MSKRRMRHPEAVIEDIRLRSVQEVVKASTYYRPKTKYLLVIVNRDGSKEHFFGGKTLEEARARRQMAFDGDTRDRISHAWLIERSEP